MKKNVFVILTMLVVFFMTSAASASNYCPTTKFGSDKLDYGNFSWVLEPSLDAAGNLVTFDWSTEKILFHSQNLQHLNEWFVTGINVWDVWGVAVAQTENSVLVLTSSGTLAKYNSLNGSKLDEISVGGSTRSLAVVGGEVYVVLGSSTMVVFDVATLAEIDRWAIPFANGCTRAVIIRPSNSGDILVSADAGCQDQLQIVSTAGLLQEVHEWGGTYSTVITNQDNGDGFYYGSSYDEVFLKLDASTGVVTEYPAALGEVGGYLNAASHMVGIDNGQIIAIDGGQSRLLKLDADFNVLAEEVGSNSSDPDGLAYPSGGVIKDNKLYVADYGGIKWYSLSGAFLGSFGFNGELSYPTNIKFDSAGNAYVMEGYPYYTMHKFDTSWNAIGQFTCSGCRDLAIHNDEIYVSLTGKVHAVEVRDLSGTVLRTIGTIGDGPTEISDWAYEVEVDLNGTVYITSNSVWVTLPHDGIRVFQNDGTYLTTITSVPEPTYIGSDLLGNLYVSNRGATAPDTLFYKLDSNYDVVLTFGTIGKDDGEFSDQSGVFPTVDSLVVLDGRFAKVTVLKSCDSDGDGILDDGDGSEVIGDNPCVGGATANCDDNCPYVVNADQADSDSDGVGNDCSKDYDADGVRDNNDNCPDTANPGQENQDGDTLGDACDLCPSDPSDACAAGGQVCEWDVGCTVSNGVGSAVFTVDQSGLFMDAEIEIIGETDLANFAIGNNAQQQLVGYVYTFEPDGLTFASPATIVLHYDQDAVNGKECGAQEQSLDIFYYGTSSGENGWVDQGAVQDCAANTLTLQIDHFSSYAIFINAEDEDEDGVGDAEDICPGTENDVPTKSLKPNHFALLYYIEPFQTPAGDSQYTIDDTQGCSCEQILAIKPGNNNGEFKHGCSQGTMEEFVLQTGWATETTILVSDGDNDEDGTPDTLDLDDDNDGILDVDDSEQESSGNDGKPDWFCAKKPSKC